MSRALGLIAALVLAASPAVAQQTSVGGGSGSASPGTGTGLLVGQTSPTLITPTLGAAAATTVNKVALTAPASGSTLTILDGKTLTVNKTLTLDGTDGQTMTFPAASATLAGLATVQTFTAAQTNSTAGTASTPAESYTGAPFTGGSATTTFPLVYINTPAATAVNQFSTGGTAFGINIHGASVANLVDLYTDNVERMLLDKNGNVTFTGVVSTASVSAFAVGTRSRYASPLDKEFQFQDSTTSFNFTLAAPSSSANVIQLGHLNAAAPAASTIQVQGSRGGTDSNVAGGNLTIASGLGTGNAAGSTISLQTPHAGSTGSVAETATTQLTLGDNSVVINQIGSDAGKTDATVCEDTTTHQLYAGSGTAGICLGTSSLRYKHGVESLDVGLAQILRLRPISYFLNADHGDPSKRLYGFAAEQMQPVLPVLVANDNKGRPNTADYLGVVPVLVKAIQQQQAQIKGLQRQVARLQRAHH